LKDFCFVMVSIPSPADGLGTHAPDAPPDRAYDDPVSRWLEATSTSARRWREHRIGGRARDGA